MKKLYQIAWIYAAMLYYQICDSLGILSEDKK